MTTYQIVSAGSDFCSTEWSAIGVTKYRNDKKEYSKNYCFASACAPLLSSCKSGVVAPPAHSAR